MTGELNNASEVFMLTLNSSMMFNTGDIVRWRKDGSLETFGRMDDQVKIKVCSTVLQFAMFDNHRAFGLNWTASPPLLRYYSPDTLRTYANTW